MSFTFHLAVSPDRSIPMGTILGDLGLGAIAVSDEWDPEESWPLGYLHLHCVGQSIRSVEVGRDARGVDVRILSCSNQADHALALALVHRFAESLEVDVEPEDGSAMPLRELQVEYGQEWVDHFVTAAPGSIAAIARMRGEVITMPGAVRAYHLGPRRLAELTAAGPEEGLGERMLADMLRVQNLDAEPYFCASVMQVGGEDGFTLAVVGPGVRYWLPKVDRYGLVAGEDTLMIEAAALSKLVPVTYIDECQILLEPIAEDDWTAFIERARGLEIPIEPGPRVNQTENRPWWKFW